MAMDLTWILSAKDNATSVFDRVKQSGEAAGKDVGSAFTGMQSKFDLVKGGLAGIAAIAAGGIFKSLIKETIEWSSEAVALSKSLGITTAEASILNVALGDVYLSKDTMLAGSQRIAKTLKAEEDAFHKLGVATRDQSGHYRDTIAIMTDVNTKLGSLKEGTDRNIAGMSIYGKSWGELSGLIKLNNEVMAEAAEKAKRLGLIVGDEQVKEMKKYKAALNDIEDVGKSLTLRFGNVLLPALVKVGAWMGKNGPVLSDALRWSLNALGFTVNTLGEWFGLMAYRAYNSFAIIKAGLTGNFSEAKRLFQETVAAGDDFSKRVKDRWNSDWNKEEKITAKDRGGDQLAPQSGDNEENALKKRLQLWKDNAKTILDTEKDLTKGIIDEMQTRLKKMQGEYDAMVSGLDTFRASYLGVLDSIAARDKRLAEEKAATLRGEEDSFNRYIRMRADLAATEAAATADPAWSNDSIARKIKLYDEMISRAEELYKEGQAGKIENISAEQAEADFLATKYGLETKIKDLGDKQIRQQEELAVKAATAIDLLNSQLELQKSHLRIIEQMLANIPKVTEKELRINVTGLEQLYQVQALMGGSTVSGPISGNGDPSSYYQVGDSMYWGDGSYAGPAFARGTSYVPRDGVAYLHKGEAVIPAAQNNGSGGGMTVSIGDIIVQGGSSGIETAREIARAIYPELQRIAGRRLAA